jgi:hypothetical protein
MHEQTVFFVLAVGIHFCAATSQVQFNRKLGVATYACFQPMRLVGSAIGSALLLAEPVTGTLTWCGLTVVGLTVSIYAYYKHTVAHKSK